MDFRKLMVIILSLKCIWKSFQGLNHFLAKFKIQKVSFSVTIFVCCNHQRREDLPLLSRGGWEPNFSRYLPPSCKLTLVIEDIRSLFLWIKSTSKQEWASKLPGELWWNVCNQLYYQNLSTWEPLTSFLKNWYVMGPICWLGVRSLFW